jgi:hypothetical protein
MVAAGEAAAPGTCSRTSAGVDRAHWNSATWHRTLAAMRLEVTYSPRICRLRLEIGQFERLMTLSIAA